jgi:Uma2 family endonuclease
LTSNPIEIALLAAWDSNGWVKNDEYVVTRPIVIVEVTSPATAAIDRREKLMAYRRLESLREYVLVAQDERSVEVFRMDQNGEWWSEQLGADSELHLESIDLNVPVRQIYYDVEV